MTRPRCASCRLAARAAAGGATPRRRCRAQLLVAGRVPPLRLPVLRRARAAAAAGRARPRGRRAPPATAAPRPTSSPPGARAGAVRARRARPRPARAAGLPAPAPPDRGDDRRGGPRRAIATPSEREAEEVGGADRSRSRRSELCARLGRADARRPRGAVRVRARRGPACSSPARSTCSRASPTGGSLVVDYKTDRLDGARPASRSSSAPTRRSGSSTRSRRCAPAPRRSRSRTCSSRRATRRSSRRSRRPTPELEHRLSGLADGVLAARFEVTDAPHRAVCHGCPAEGGLCSWPLAMTRRESPDRCSEPL